MLVGSWLVVALLFWETATTIVRTWASSATFSHGFLVLPMSLFLVWARRAQVIALIPRPSYLAMPFLAGLAFMWLLGRLADVLVVEQLAMAAMLPGLVWAVLGAPVFRALLLPLAFLFFTVPLGEELVPPLQDFTALFTVTGLHLSGIPVSWDGRLITVPTGRWVVAEACAGVRYLIASVVAACFYVALFYEGWPRRVNFLLAAIAVPILANGLRAYGIVMLAHMSNNRIAAGVDHIVYGWLFFGIVMTPLYLIGLRWREPVALGDRHRAESHPQQAMLSAPAFGSLAATAMTSVALLALAPLGAATVWAVPVESVTVRAHVPLVTPPWQPVGLPGDSWRGHFPGSDAEVVQSYVAGGPAVNLYIAYYRSQRQGAEVVNSENRLNPGVEWTVVDAVFARAVSGARTFQVRETLFQSPSGRRHLVWSWYWVGGQFTATGPLAKLRQLQVRLAGRRQEAAAIVLATDYRKDRSETAATLQDFLRHSASIESTLSEFATNEGDRTGS